MTKSTEKIFNKIKELCAEKGCCIETNKFLADELKVSERTILRAIKHLEDNNNINVQLRTITIVGIDGECQDLFMRIDSGSEQDTFTDIELEHSKLKRIPVYQTASVLELLELGCKEKYIETDIDSRLIENFIRIFGFKQVLNTLEDFLAINLRGNILQKDFKKYLDEKYINIPNVIKIREDVKTEF